MEPLLSNPQSHHCPNRIKDSWSGDVTPSRVSALWSRPGRFSWLSWADTQHGLWEVLLHLSRSWSDVQVPRQWGTVGDTAQLCLPGGGFNRWLRHLWAGPCMALRFWGHSQESGIVRWRGPMATAGDGLWRLLSEFSSSVGRTLE